MSKYSEEILEIVLNSKDHLTAEQIYLEMKRRNSKISQATIYNNLNALTSAGKIIRLSETGQPDHYDNTTRHDHLFCDVCGKIADITLKDLTSSIEEKLGQYIISYDLRIHYVCPECQKKGKH